MAAYVYRMPAGIPGEVTRLQTYGATIEPDVINAAAAATGAALSPPSWAYGAIVVIDANGVRPVVAGDTADVPLQMGVLVRPFPGPDLTVAFPAGTVPFGAGKPPTTGIVDVLRRGYVNIKLNSATAGAKGGSAYLYYGTSTGAHVQGGIEAAGGGNLVQLTQAFLQGAADASGNTEMAWNL